MVRHSKQKSSAILYPWEKRPQTLHTPWTEPANILTSKRLQARMISVVATRTDRNTPAVNGNYLPHKTPVGHACHCLLHPDAGENRGLASCRSLPPLI